MRDVGSLHAAGRDQRSPGAGLRAGSRGPGSEKPATRDFESPIERKIADLAQRQHGVVASAHLRQLGMSSSAIHRWTQIGRLHRLHRGTYAVGHTVLTRHGRWMAAVLACGPGAVLSHRDAAALMELRPDNRREIDVSAPRSRHAHRGVTLHRPRELHGEEVTVIDGIPVTSLARTLLDLAAVLRSDQLERVVEQAELRGLFDLIAVDRALMRNPSRRGRANLLSVIADMRPFTPMTRSELEREFVRICLAAGLPMPAMNVWLLEYEVDALFAEDRIVVELDGGPYHATTAARRRDPVRDARLQAAGYRILRVHERWLHDAPAAIGALMRTSRLPA